MADDNSGIRTGSDSNSTTERSNHEEVKRLEYLRQCHRLDKSKLRITEREIQRLETKLSGDSSKD